MKPSHFKYNISDDVETLIERSGIDVRLLKGKSMLVTGGTGFFGIWMLSALVKIKQLLKGEINIKVLSREPALFIEKHRDIEFEKYIEFIEREF